MHNLAISSKILLFVFQGCGARPIMLVQMVAKFPKKTSGGSRVLSNRQVSHSGGNQSMCNGFLEQNLSSGKVGGS